MLNLQMQAAYFDYIKSAEGNQEILLMKREHSNKKPNSEPGRTQILTGSEFSNYVGVLLKLTLNHKYLLSTYANNFLGNSPGAVPEILEF